MRKLRRSVEKNRRLKKAAATAAMVMLSAGLVVGSPIISLHAAETPSLSPAVTRYINNDTSITVYDIDTCPINNNLISIDITNSGAYKLTGSNLRNGAYVDVKINIGRNATVDLYIDGLNIVNDDVSTDVVAGSSFFGLECVSPITVDGTANVYVMGNSSIAAVEKYFTVNGTLNFVESYNNAELTLSLSKYYAENYLPTAIAGSGRVEFLGAKGVLRSTLADGSAGYDSMYIKPTLYLGSTALVFSGMSPFSEYPDESIVILPNYHIKEGFGLRSSQGSFRDINDNTLNRKDVTLYEMPANAEVIQINKNPVSDLTVAADGTLSHMFMPEGQAHIIVKDGDTYKHFLYWNSNHPNSATPETAYLITFIDASNSSVLKTYYDIAGSSLALLPPSDEYEYTYTLGSAAGDEVTDDTTVGAGNMTIYVTKTEKERVTVTVDGTGHPIRSGATLAESGLTGLYKDTAGNQLITSEKVITEPLTLVTVSGYTKENGMYWFTLNSAESVCEFATLVNEYGATDFNARLTADVSLGNTYTMIGNSDHPFCGIFDGQNHNVSLSLSKDSMNIGMFGVITSGAEIKNVNLTGAVECTHNNAADNYLYYAGTLAGSILSKNGSQVRISKCTSAATVTSYGTHVGALVGSIEHADNQNMNVTIDSCSCTGVLDGLSSSSSLYCGMVGYNGISTSSEIINCYCYQTADPYRLCGYGNITITDSYTNCQGTEQSLSNEAFASGEAAYRINTSANSQIWFQTCGIGLPSLTGDPATQTVYGGYANCTSSDLIYQNTPIAHTEQGHKDKAESYTYSDGKIIAKCMYCDEDITATINTADEEKSSSMRGVTADYSTAWTGADFPAITFKYSDAKDGDYTDTQPTEAGTWYVKAYVGTSQYEVAITDPYTIKPEQDTTPDDNTSGGGTTTGGGTTGGGTVSGGTGTAAVSGAETGKDNSTGKSSSDKKADSESKDSSDTKFDFNVEAAQVTFTASKKTVQASLNELKTSAGDNGCEAVSITAAGSSGKTKFTAFIDAEDLDAGEFVVYKIDKKGRFIAVNPEKNFAKVSEDGELTLKISSKGNFKLMTKEDAEKAEAAILNTVAVKKKSATLKEGETTSFKLSKKCDMRNVANISYSSDNEDITVDENGNITAVRAGKASITATITLKNGKTKTVSMKIKM